MSERPGQVPRDDESEELTVPEWSIDLPGDDRLGGSAPAIGSKQGDCCASRPAFRVVVPPSACRPHPSELLLCGHHYRVSRESLARIGAAAYDALGRLVASGGSVHVAHQPAGRR